MVRSLLLRFGPTLLVVVAICLLSLLKMPSVDTGFQIPGLDKAVHFCMYGGLMFVYRVDLLRHPCPPVVQRRLQWTGLLVVLLLGGCMEGLQGLTLYRSADWLDMAANAAGALAGYGAGALLSGLLRRRKPLP